tara:strand:- start:99 stop:239 length:141 start_codon:yes stop_codon:yes gene_type:complete
MIIPRMLISSSGYLTVEARLAVIRNMAAVVTVVKNWPAVTFGVVLP